MGYTKLFSEIIMSTIWREDDKTRIVWITMLAIRDRWHVVNASVPGLADAARVSIEDCRRALQILSSPDPDSRTKESEGRRIKEVQGGWFVINGELYRNKMSLDERREYNRTKQTEYRRRKESALPSCVQSSTQCTQTETETETDIKQNAHAQIKEPSNAQAQSKSKVNPPHPPKGSERAVKGPSKEFEEFWQNYPKKRDKARCMRIWNLRKLDAHFAQIMAGLRIERMSAQWTKDKGEYIPHPSTWLNNERWESASRVVEVIEQDWASKFVEEMSQNERI